MRLNDNNTFIGINPPYQLSTVMHFRIHVHFRFFPAYIVKMHKNSASGHLIGLQGICNSYT